MIREKDDLDQLLHSYFQEEARRLELPDTGRCWEDFQRLLEERGENSLYLDKAIPQPKGIVYLLGQKYRNLSALAAACILGIMLLSGMPPFQTLRETLGEMLPRTNKMASTKMERQDTERETELADGMPGAAKAPDPLQITQSPELAAPPVAEDAPPGQRTAPEGAGEMGILQVQGTVAGETDVLNYASLSAYRSALQENKGFIRGKIFYLAVPPEGYTFREAAIYKAEASLLSVRQEFSNNGGDILVVQQDFFEAELAGGKAPPGAPEEEEARVLAGELFGQGELKYELLPLNGQNMMRIVLEGSVLTLTAGLDEEGLLLLSSKLEELDNS